MKKQFLLPVFLILTFSLYSQIDFEEEIIIQERPSSIISSQLSDFDADGDLDLITRHNFGIFINENIDGLGTFSRLDQKLEIGFGNYNFEVGDFDGDNIEDLFFYKNNDIFNSSFFLWYKNVGGNYILGDTININTPLKLHEDLKIVDFDFDGDLDILTTKLWYENDGVGNFLESSLFPNNLGYYHEILKVVSGDLDGDNDSDVLFMVRWSGDLHLSIMKSENIGNNTYDSLEIIKDSLPIISTNMQIDRMFLDIDDINGDGALDIVYSSFLSSQEMGWFENLGIGGFSSSNNFTGSPYNYNAKNIVDFDNDGDLDMIFDDVWAENIDGLGNFQTQSYWNTTFNSYFNNINFGDIDNDGDLD